MCQALWRCLESSITVNPQNAQRQRRIDSSHLVKLCRSRGKNLSLTVFKRFEGLAILSSFCRNLRLDWRMVDLHFRIRIGQQIDGHAVIVSRNFRLRQDCFLLYVLFFHFSTPFCSRKSLTARILLRSGSSLCVFSRDIQAEPVMLPRRPSPFSPGDSASAFVPSSG